MINEKDCCKKCGFKEGCKPLGYEAIEGAIHDYLSDWKSEYKIHEDLPHIAEQITEFIFNVLKDWKLKIIKK